METLDKTKTLRELFKEGIGIGCTIRLKAPERRDLIFFEKENKYGEQTLTDESMRMISYEIISNPTAEGILVFGEPREKIYLTGAVGAVNGNSILNEYCKKMYETDYLRIKGNITMEDLNQLLNIKVIDGKVIQENNPKNNLNMYEERIGKEHVFDGNEYSPESYLEKRYETKGKKIYSTEYSYEITNLKISRKIKNIIFKDTTYWLSNNWIYIDGNDVLYVQGTVENCGTGSSYLFDSEGIEKKKGFAVRPVGYIDPDIPIENLGIKEIVIPEQIIQIM